MKNHLYTKLNEFVENGKISIDDYTTHKHADSVDVRMSTDEEEIQNILGKIYIVSGDLKHISDIGSPYFKVVQNDGEKYKVKIPLIKANELTTDDIKTSADLDLETKEILVDWLKSKSTKAENKIGIINSNVKFCASTWNLLNINDGDMYHINTKLYGE